MGDPYLGSSGHSSIFRGIHSSLILYALNGISDALQGYLWKTLPVAIGVNPANGSWIFGLLTLSDIAVGLSRRCRRFHPN